MSDISDWLEVLGLGVHVNTFLDNDVDMETLTHLTEAMLKEMRRPIGTRAMKNCEGTNRQVLCPSAPSHG